MIMVWAFIVQKIWRWQKSGAEVAQRSKYYVLKSKRDKEARSEYLNSNRSPSYRADELYILDILRQEVKSDDSRL